MKSALCVLLTIFCLSSCALAREDLKTYYSDIDTPAVWINPKQIKVYMMPDETKFFIFERSFKAWDDALGSDLNFKYVKTPDEADITIKYVDKLTGTTAGITKTQHMKIQGKIYLGRVDISISRTDPMGLKFTDTTLNKVTLHEIGHAIGILGHSENINDIMYYSTASNRLSTLSRKDVETAKKIYGF